MQHAHHVGIVIDREEDAIRVWLPAVAQYPNWLIRIDGLRCNGTALRVLLEGKNGALETVEPFGALLRRPRHDPEVQLFELRFRVLGDLNAVCHACGAADRALAAQSLCDRP